MTDIAFVVPVYQHGDTLSATLRDLSVFPCGIVVVNDGSDENHSRRINLACEEFMANLVERKQNGGKGAAVIDGLRRARDLGFSHAFQVDADAQHELGRVEEFLDQAARYPSALVLGYPIYDDSVPMGRLVSRYLTHIWVWINSLSFEIKDSMCGFRIYPVDAILEIIDGCRIGKHMEFDSELCVRASWQGLQIVNIPVEVHYPIGGRSNFRLLRDNALISWMHTRMFFGMLIRLPGLLPKRLGRVFTFS